MELTTPLSAVEGIGPINARKLQRLNLFSVDDLIHHYPFRYDDFSKVTRIIEAQFDTNVTLKGEIWSIKNTYTRFRRVLTKAVLNDGSGPIEIVWFNQSWLTKSLKPGDKIQISGKVGKNGSKLSILSPEWEKIEEGKDGLHTGRLVPIYPETYGLSSKWIRNKISILLPSIKDKIPDPLPKSIKEGMEDLSLALSMIHFPNNWEEINLAKQRLSFDELFFIQLATQKRRSEWRKIKAVKKLTVPELKVSEFIRSLPFELTNAQNRVNGEILEDLSKNYPMNRLLQGEVGSGKTAVAAIAIYAVFLNQMKVFFMAPTEILAFQHLTTLEKLLSPFGIKVGIYTGSRKRIEDADILIGTHALLSNKLALEDIGLVIIDEQQRFGVGQRSLLRSKAHLPHFLSMTATPIPRTVALTLYGDLDLSIINEMPKGRKEVKTFVVFPHKREGAYGFIAKKVSQGDQAYIITPLIEESETLLSAKAAKAEFERLRTKVFPKLRLGLLHGKLKSKEKEQVINSFKGGDIDILVSTSVVEVGMDITNATIMLIEGADRFGLSALHQLRGRVGRGNKESYCLLFSSVEEKSAYQRLKSLEKTNDGLKLAELDLKIRGSGDIFGLRQSGRWNLKIASFKDLSLIEKTRRSASSLLEKDPTLDKYPLLQAKLHDISAEVLPD